MDEQCRQNTKRWSKQDFSLKLSPLLKGASIAVDHFFIESSKTRNTDRRRQWSAYIKSRKKFEPAKVFLVCVTSSGRMVKLKSQGTNDFVNWSQAFDLLRLV